MGELAHIDSNGGHRGRYWWERDGNVVYLDPEERMEAAAADDYLQAYCELKEIKITEVPLPDSIIDILTDYTPENMIYDLRARYGVSQEAAAMLIEEATAGVKEQERVRSQPHAY